MKIENAVDLAEKLMRQHALSCWTVIISNSRTFLGRCWYKPRCQIELSRHHILADTDAEITDTILHEIAHAITGYEKGNAHGAQWKSAAKRVGATPKRCSENSVVQPRKRMYTISCAKCLYTHQQAQRPKYLVGPHTCPKCGNTIYWNH